ncbi:hypothetical protein ABGB18_38835 [Nonomuraea sp. B12E4]|uniref:hypothetical protein n=1 Tax=Nonomuraea sp. B12E4 TaxID=3153564 RepID=UPI00325EB692
MSTPPPPQPPYGGQPTPPPPRPAPYPPPPGPQPYGAPYPQQPNPAWGGAPPFGPPPPKRRRVGLVLGLVGGGLGVVVVIAVALAVIGLRSGSGLPDARFALTLPKTLIDGRFQLAQDLSDSEGQKIEDEAGAGYVEITDSVVGQYTLGGDQAKGVLVLSGMYGRFRDTNVSRENMLKGAAEADGVTVAAAPKVFTQKGMPTVSCEVLTQKKLDTTVTYPLCAWTDDNTGAAVGVITPKSAAQDPSTIDLQFYAKLTLQVRSETVKAIT